MHILRVHSLLAFVARGSAWWSARVLVLKQTACPDRLGMARHRILPLLALRRLTIGRWDQEMEGRNGEGTALVGCCVCVTVESPKATDRDADDTPPIQRLLV